MLSPTDAEFTARLRAYDLTLFDAVDSQSSAEDRRAWLALQHAVRARGTYVYLEIGSHLGGSIQQHLPDPRCLAVISIDKRPLEQPDDRGQTFRYEGNSSARMLAALRRASPDGVARVRCYDRDARDVSSADVPERPSLCFIDGEHTRRAILSDFAACRRLAAPDAVIAFHDDSFTFDSIAVVLAQLRRERVPFTARKLGGDTFAVFLRECDAADDAMVAEQSQPGEPWLRQMMWARRLRFVRLVVGAPYRWMKRLLR
jgi:hypothetical protein